ncbi:hypothetical protein AB833_09305 [Chromatiales bacterium (ex Bugula neritina AB1)]|nr:hypothetical protein AB833_09305 [Chromatiales bacterium (ex Bugula neritina AB1)]
MGVTTSSQALAIEKAGYHVSVTESQRTRATFAFRNGEVHTRTVEHIGPHAIAESDMIVGWAEDLFENSGRRLVKGVINSSYGQTWPNGVVPYRINPELSESVVENILGAVDHWNSIGAITMVERTASKAAIYPDYIEFVDSSRCASWIGFQAAGMQKIYTGDNCSEGSMIHEIGHSLGLLHEHTRPDRDNFVIIHWDRIMTNMEPNFEIMPGSESLGSYDYGSIMHYGASFFSVDGRPTIEPIQATTETIGQRISTSAGDKQSVINLYKSDLSLVSNTVEQPVSVGSPIEVNLHVTNNSTVGANSLQVVMPVPASSLLLSYSAAEWSCSQRGIGANIVCNSPVLVGGADTSFGITVSTDSTSTGHLFFDSTLTSRTPDTDMSDNHDSAVVNIDGGTPVVAAAKRQVSNSNPASSGNTVPLSGGSGAFNWLYLGFLLVLFPFIRVNDF